MIIPVLKMSYTEGNVLKAIAFCDNCECEILTNELVYQSEQHEFCEYCWSEMKKEHLELYWGEEPEDYSEEYCDDILTRFLRPYRKRTQQELVEMGMKGRAKLRRMGYDV